MPPRHARAEDDDDSAGATVPPLRLVDLPPGHEPFEPPGDDFSPEVRAVLDAVATLHTAVIGWAAATAGASPRHHAAPAEGTGRHRR